MVDNQNFLQRIDRIRDDESTVQEHGNEYLIHLDNYSSATGSYNSTTPRST